MLLDQKNKNQNKNIGLDLMPLQVVFDPPLEEVVGWRWLPVDFGVSHSLSLAALRLVTSGLQSVGCVWSTH